MTTLELIAYYVQLLIIQYTGKPAAEGTISTLAAAVVMAQTSSQLVSFSAAPVSGTFTLTYDGQTTAAIDWNDTAADVQTALRALTGLSAITVAGNFTDGFTVTFTGVTAPAELLTATSSLATSVKITVAETDLILPLAVQAGFNITGDSLAQGAQLDVLGKYVGVSRSGPGFSGTITLSDEDFASLIQMAIIKNSAGSSLSVIQALLYQFFPLQVLVFDYKNMQMSYLVSTDVGSIDLIQMFIVQGLLPRPMGVQLGIVIYAPVITEFFGFRTYETEAFNSNPFNRYDDWNTDFLWLSYSNAVYV
jgi:hypothetical protein